MAGLGEHLRIGRANHSRANHDGRGGGAAGGTDDREPPDRSCAAEDRAGNGGTGHGATRLGGDGLAGDSALRARLARTIEGEIIPRLKLAHGAGLAEGPAGRFCAPDSAAGITADDILAFAKLAIANEVGVALAHIEVMRAQGSSLDSIFLDLLAPAARVMGDMWLADECSFIDVTIGLARLQQAVRELSAEFEPELDEARPRRRALLLPVAGEQHSLGVSMVEQFFRRAGWEVAAPPRTDAALTASVRKEWFTMVGFSVGRVELLDSLQTVIRSLRHTSRNPNLIVMVGGAAFTDKPELVSRVGADAMALDGRSAVLAVNGLLAASTPGSADGPRAKANWKRNGASGLTRYGTPV